MTTDGAGVGRLAVPAAAAAAADPTTTSTPPPPPSPTPPPPPPACYLVQHAIAKAANVGTLARLATAFGAAGVLVVSPSPRISTFGAHGADAHVPFTHFTRLADAKAWLHARGVALVGVEIDERAVPVTEPGAAFAGPSAFLLGNEGEGLTPASLSACDSLVYIPQHGPGTASLNVACAAAIILHRFTAWAGFAERGREGAKFCVAPRPQRTSARGRAAPADVEAARAERKAAGRVDWAACEGGAGLGGVFGE